MKRLRSILVTIILVTLAGSSFAGTYGGGSGTEEDPYQIVTAEHLVALGENPDDYDKHFVMTADIDLGGYFFSKAVIAPETNDDIDLQFNGTPFTGIFDGAGHRIIDLRISTDGKWTDYLGLFGMISGEHAEIMNLKLENISVIKESVGRFVGGLCGENFSGKITNCHIDGIINCHPFSTGILCGINSGTISNCHTIGNIDGLGYIGGLCGENYGTISNCNAAGNINGAEFIGGLCGINNGTITNCYSSSSVSCGYGPFAGFHGSESGYVGGLCGANVNTGRINNCYAGGTVEGWFYVAGLCGYNNDASISNCYAIGSVIGWIDVGGLCGINQGAITCCYSTAIVTGKQDSENLAALCGLQDGEASHITHCFWDKNTCEMDVGYNLSSDKSGTVTNVLSKTTAQLHQQSTFTDWDFLHTWTIGENQTYPYLRTYSAADLNKDKIVNMLDLSIMAEQWMAISP